MRPLKACLRRKHEHVPCEPRTRHVDARACTNRQVRLCLLDNGLELPYFGFHKLHHFPALVSGVQLDEHMGSLPPPAGHAQLAGFVTKCRAQAVRILR